MVSCVRFITSKIPGITRGDIIILTLSISLLLIGAALLFKSSNEWIYWKYDDAEHLSVAYNFIHGKGLTKDAIDIEASQVLTNINSLKKYDQISQPLRAKPPLHLILLGAWLYVTQATFRNWVFWGNIFNLLLTVLSIIIFYFFIKRHFGFEISAYSTPVIALMPSLLWFSVRVRPEILAFIMSILTVHFGSSTIRSQNVILAGIFCGLAHFTHPIGMVTGWALLVYYLLGRKFKAAAILVAAWIAVISPWMFRNLLIFGDATQGFGIPVPRSLLIAIGLIRPDLGPYSDVAGTSGGLSLSVANVPLYSTIVGMLDEFGRLYGMQFFMIFISMSIFAFVSFSTLRKLLFPGYMKIIIFMILIALYGRAVLFAVALNTNKEALPIQVIILLLVPFSIFLYIKLFSRHKNLFSSNESSVAQILGILGVLTFLPYLMFAQLTGRIVPEVRILTWGLYMVIPLAIIGLKRIIRAITILLHKNLSSRALQKLMIIVLAIIIIPQAYQGIISIDAFQNRYHEEVYQKNMHDWIRNNIPLNSNIASELPSTVLLRTGLPTVNFQYIYKDNVDYENWIIKKFDLDYLVFYYPKDKNSVSLQFTNLDGFKLVPVYEGPRNIVYKIQTE